jgi:hypothetical protein
LAADVRLRLERFPRNRFQEVWVMDDRTIPPPPGRAVIRRCEASRFQKELLARAYQHLSPEVRRTRIDGAAPPARTQQGLEVESLTARRLAKGA